MSIFDRFGGKKKPETLSAEQIQELLDRADALCDEEKYDEAFALDKKAADAGSPRAQTHLGWYYENGAGVDADPAAAFEWYSKAAEQGFAPAQYCLALCYEDGIGTAVNLGLAIKYCLMAQKQGLEEATEAMMRISDKLQGIGQGAKPDTVAIDPKPEYTERQINRFADEARRLFVQELFDQAAETALPAAEAGHANAQHVLGMCLLNPDCTSRNTATAIEWLHASAKGGFAPAMLELGSIYHAGDIVAKDLERAAELFETAVKTNSRPAYFYLGQCYEYGEGVERDLERAINLYNTGADAGDPAAHYALGQCFLTGTHVPEDYDLAHYHFKVAVDNGYEAAAEGLATIEQLRNDEQATKMVRKLEEAAALIEAKKYDEATPLIKDCAEVGMPLAQRFLGDFYVKALGGLPRDPNQAREWYTRAADGGDVDAMLGLGLLLANTVTAKAIQWYVKAYDAGSVEAAYRLGNLYASVPSVKNPKEAHKWFKIAADKGHAEAKRQLELLDRPAEEKKKPETPAKEPKTPLSDTELTEEQKAHMRVASLQHYNREEYKQCFEIDQQLAAIDDPKGMHNLGYDYLHGIGTEVDFEKALFWFKRSADAGEAKAFTKIGYLYETGNGVPQDDHAAFEWYLKGAKAGHSIAMTLVGQYIIDGKGTHEDYAVAKQWLLKAAEAGSAEAYDNLVTYFENDYTDAESAELLFKGAALGFDDSALSLGMNFEDSDPARSVYFFRLAYALGATDAVVYLPDDMEETPGEEEIKEMTNRCSKTYGAGNLRLALEESLLPAALGNPYAKEIKALCLTFGDFKHTDLAAKLFEEAARAGLSASQHNIGVRYETGDGVEKSPIDAAYWYRMAAENGHRSSMSVYAWCLLKGTGVKQNYAEAMKWYSKAAEKGDSNAMYNIGTMYENGYGVDVNLDKAREYYTRAAAAGFAKAQKAIDDLNKRAGVSPAKQDGIEADRLYNAGDYAKAFPLALKAAQAGDALGAAIAALCYEFGKGTKADLVQAVKWYQQGAAGGWPSSLLNLGVAYQFGKGGLPIDLKRSCDLYRQAAEKGDKIAQCNLAWNYERGEGVAQSWAEAVKWYTRSADQGWARAQVNLGICYENGTGATKDIAKAVELYRKAAAQNNTFAASRLASCYHHGKGVAVNLAEAERLYKIAADGGSDFAKKQLETLRKNSDGNLGQKANDLYFAGKHDEAFRVATQASAQGDAVGALILAYCYEYGKSTTADNKKAAELYLLAADRGNALGQVNIGYRYEVGQGVPEDKAKAAHYYRLAAEAGNATAQCNLGYCYERGIGVDKNLATALTWYRKSEAQNHARAFACIADFYKKGIGGLNRDSAMALTYYKKAADGGNTYGQACLGECYENGMGTKRDIEMAKYWYRKAAASGYAWAKTKLESLK